MKHKIHDLKTWPEPFRAVGRKQKTAEFRLNDRYFKKGDLLNLREWNPDTKLYTGYSLLVEVKHILQSGFGIPDGYCVMSINLIGSPVIIKEEIDGR